MDPAQYDDQPVQPPEWSWQPRPKFQDRVWLHLALFVLTIGTTALAGADFYASFVTDQLQRPLTLSLPQLLVGGLWYGGTILAILGFHELGHYLACRYYGIDASLPFFVPMPLVFSGTMGAFIRIREPLPNKRTLFDVGIAGPLAGFVVLVPALFLGVMMSSIIPEPTELPPGAVSFEFGEPLLLKLMLWLVWGQPAAGYAINLHPVAHAAWFGMLATTLNLFPIGQLDGGHVSYALLGRRSTSVTYLTVGVTAGLIYFAGTWIGWTVLMVLMLWFLGPRHPPVPDEDAPLDRTRLILVACAILIFALCFTAAPLRIVDVIRH